MTGAMTGAAAAANQPLIRLAEIAHARSGDKGNHANIGVIAYTGPGYAFIQKELTPAVVKAFFRSLGAEVERFTLPKILACNFLLRNALAGGAADSLRTDTQGKVLATALLEMELPRPENWQAMLRSDRT
jgi:hypothetical protein